MSTKAITRAIENATSVEDVDRKTRTITHKINTDAVDRYQTVIMPEGMRCENFRLNPVVLCNHNFYGLPIARNLDLKTYKRKIIARTKFLPEGKDEMADKVFDLYEGEFLNGWSISFDEIEAGKPTPDEIRKRPQLAEARCIYRVWDLLEYSCVTIPGNQEVARKARSRGLALPGWPDDPPPATTPPAIVAAPLPPLVGRSFDQVLESVTRCLKAETKDLDKRAVRDAYDLAKGMV